MLQRDIRACMSWRGDEIFRWDDIMSLVRTKYQAGLVCHKSEKDVQSNCVKLDTI